MTTSFVIISKDEATLDETLVLLEDQIKSLPTDAEIVVVDASSGRMDAIRRAHATVVWIDFQAPEGVTVSIPHQRNAGVRAARGDIVVFTDCGCLPEPTWARELIAPILDRAESVTVGRTVGRGPTNLYRSTETSTSTYLAECPTINVAFSRAAFDAVAGFDESFAYGSDIDFSWRLVAAGHRLRSVPQAVISVNWGNPRRQIRRAWLYGRARARLYRKHPARARSAWRTDPVPFAYGLFLLGLPLTLFIPVYPLLLILPVARNRDEPALLMLLDHILNGAGFLRGMLD